MEFFDNGPEVQAKKYAFKCHRKGLTRASQMPPKGEKFWAQELNSPVVEWLKKGLMAAWSSTYLQATVCSGAD
eukprot:627275-Pyramimonas_sp.AAC.1